MSAEERRRDREEYRQLWRDTQRQIHETNAAIERTNAAVERVAVKVDQFIDETREAKAAQDERIDKLVSAIGAFLAR